MISVLSEQRQDGLCASVGDCQCLGTQLLLSLQVVPVQVVVVVDLLVQLLVLIPELSTSALFFVESLGGVLDVDVLLLFDFIQVSNTSVVLLNLVLHVVHSDLERPIFTVSGASDVLESVDVLVVLVGESLLVAHVVFQALDVFPLSVVAAFQHVVVLPQVVELSCPLTQLCISVRNVIQDLSLFIFTIKFYF